jgi:hypothetical protein
LKDKIKSEKIVYQQDINHLNKTLTDSFIQNFTNDYRLLLKNLSLNNEAEEELFSFDAAVERCH